MSQALERKLSFSERVAMRMHLFICRGCRAVNAQFQFLRRAVHRLLDA